MSTAEVCISWQIDDDHALAVSIEVNGDRPDLLDDICNRAVHVFNEALATVDIPSTEEDA